MKIIQPSSSEEFEKYFALRYEILRKPWSQPLGSEKDAEEDKCIHRMVMDEKKNAVGVCRLQINSRTQGQLRYMAVAGNMQGKGIGKMLLQHMEGKARLNNLTELILQARENAVEFYKANGYEVVAKSYLMWGVIQHYLMKKEL